MISPQMIYPRSAQQVCEAVTDAASTGRRLRVSGGASKRPVLDGCTFDVLLDTRNLAGITRYEPEELVLSLGAGTPLAEVEAVLDQRHQRLGFEPPAYAGLLGTAPGGTTLGGVVASGFAGPARPSAGNVRDHVLGFDAVSGRGEAFHAGGRVMKNVTGYDLAKLMAGSWGTLAILTALTLRVLPKPEHETTLVIEGLDDRAALRAMTRAMQAPLEVTAAAHLPGVPSRTTIRLEGFRGSVVERLRLLTAALGTPGPARTLEGEDSRVWWRGIREVQIFHGDARIVWRLSLPPAACVDVVAAISSVVANQAIYDWGGGLVWMALDSATDASAGIVRGECARAGGHAWLMRAPADVRRAVGTAHPQGAALCALSRRVRKAFDPQDVFGSEPLLPDPARA